MSMDKVTDENIWIGGFFTLRARTALKEAGITHVLSVLRFAIDKTILEPYKHMQVELDDVEDENILEHFPETNRFISEALEMGGHVFIHCAMGKSRSATILAAYLMSTRRVSPDEALALIRRTRPMVEPNPAFMEQLKLYENMEYTDHPDDHPMYQRWLYQQEVAMSNAAGMAPEHIHFRDAEQELAGLAEVKEGDGSSKTELKCKKCRRVLANSRVLEKHVPKTAQPPSPQQPAISCSHYFLEPLLWMKPELEEGKLEGKLECPKCKAKVGSYAWQGIKCSCGDWVVPGISIARGKVDQTRVKL